MTKVTEKDKSFILLLVVTGLILYITFSFIGKLYFRIKLYNSDLVQIIQNKDNQIQILGDKNDDLKRISYLKNKILVFYFTDKSCSTCVKTYYYLDKINKKNNGSLHVFVISNGISNYINPLQKKLLTRSNLSHTIIDDKKFALSKKFKINNNNQLIIHNFNYTRDKKFELGVDFDYSNLAEAISKSYNKKKYDFTIDNKFTNLYPKSSNILSYPSKVEFVKEFEFNNIKMPAMIVSNSLENEIFVSKLNGDILYRIGSGETGFRDGNFNEAKFNYPNGIKYLKNKLYVADTYNDAIRVIDFKENKVDTVLVKTKAVSYDLSGNKILSPDLSFPYSVDYYKDNLIILNYNSDNLISYDLGEKKNISFFLESKKYPKIAISDFEIYNNKVFLHDYLTNSVYLYQDKRFKKLIDNSDKNIKSSIYIDETGFYFFDNNTKELSKYNLDNNGLRFAKHIKIDYDESNINFNFSNDLTSFKNEFYIVDSSNNRVVNLSRDHLELTVVDIFPHKINSDFELPRYLNNVSSFKKIDVSDKKSIKIKININEKVYLNKLAPNYLSLIEFDNKSGNLVKFYELDEIKNNEINLPKLKNEKKYLISGKLYYCEKEKNSICRILKVNNVINFTNNVENDAIIIYLN